MNYKPYPPEKRGFILKKSEDELWEFFQEISNSEKLIDILPEKTTGLEANNPKGVDQRFRMLIQEARGSETSPKTQNAWEHILLIWKAWIKSHPALQALLDNYDNRADFQEDGGVNSPNLNTSLDIGCFTYLVQVSHTHKLSRAVIQRFYEFGYFQLDSTIEFIIKTIQEPSEKPNEVVEKRVENELTLDKWQKAPQELQIRVTQIEAHEQKPDEPEQHNLLLEKQLVEIQQQNVFARVSTLEKNQQNLVTQLNTVFVEKIDNMSQTVDAIKNQLEMTTQSTIDVDKLKQQFDGLEKQLRGEISPTVEFISKQLAVFPFKTEVNELKQQIEFITHQLVAIPLKTELDELRQQLNQLENELSEQGEFLFDKLEQHNTVSPIHDSAAGYLIQQTGLYTSTLQRSDSPHILSSKEKRVSLLTDNLKAIGLIKDSAEELAKEILAGLSAGELIVFSGSFAFNLAEVCTQALAASAKQPPIVIHIPIGLLNGQQFGDYLWTIIKKTKMSEQVCAIIIEGINRSALETYAQALRQIIIKRLLRQPDPAPHLLFFGTLVEGLSTLPVPLELCELGPIFNTDVLEWRSQFQAYQAGAISCSVWQRWITTRQNESAEQNGKTTLDLAEVCNDFAFCRSQLWQLCVKNASRHLDNNLHSLAFGWLVPRATAAELDWTEIKKWLQEQIFPKGIIQDKRLDILSTVIN